MHQVVRYKLEEFLAGTLDSTDQGEVDAHLAECAACRQEVGDMRNLSSLMASLRAEETAEDAPVPSPGFYARVALHVDAQQRSSIWMSFLQPAFGRRVAFASLLLLATLGGILVSSESDYAAIPSPEMVLAIEREPSAMPVALPDRDHMLVTLAGYK